MPSRGPAVGRRADRPLPPAGRVQLAVVTVAALVAAAVVVRLTLEVPARPAILALLALGSALHTEMVRRVELRRGDADDRYLVDIRSMWGFAAVLLEPGWAAIGLMTVMGLYSWARAAYRGPFHHAALAVATAVLASCAAEAVLLPAPVDPVRADSPLALLVVAAAAVVRWGVALAVTELGPRLARTQVRRPSPATLADARLAFGGLALGVVLAVLVDDVPWLVPVLVVPAVAVHRGSLLAHLARTVHLDDKTGLVSASHWEGLATEALSRARRRGTGLAVLMVDIDEFKRVNDRHGHLVGDRVLRAVADEVADEVRDEDVVGRFGGEEFVVLLTRVGRRAASAAEAAGSTAERIRRRVSELAVPLQLPAGSARLRDVSVSVGVAVYPGTADDLETLVRAADEALYTAKRDGRNRVRLAPLAADPEPA